MDLMPPVNNAEKAANESGLWTKFSPLSLFLKAFEG